MAKMQIKGLAAYEKALSQLEMRVKDQVVGAAIYDGAKLLADAIRADMEDIRIDNRGYSTTGKLMGPNTKQVLGLLHSLGISPMRTEDGISDVAVGFDGYNDIKTKRWPKGQPNAMVARSVERGTSFMEAQPIFKRVTARMRKPVQQAMGKSVDKSIEKIMKKQGRDDFWYSEFEPG